MMDFLKELDPRTWLWRLAGVAAVVALGWWAWGSFKEYITAPAVEAAVQAEKARTDPIIDGLNSELATNKEVILTMNNAIKEERERQIAQAAQKQKLYNEVVKQNANLSAKLKTSFAAADDVASQLRDITTRSRAACTADGDYQRRLGDALAQCETDLNRVIREAEATASVAAEALAAARALKN